MCTHSQLNRNTSHRQQRLFHLIKKKKKDIQKNENLIPIDVKTMKSTSTFL